MAERGWSTIGWTVPAIVGLSENGRRLVWSYKQYRRVRGDGGRRAEPADAGKKLLEGFLALANPDAKPERFVRFALRYGVFHHRGEPFWGEGEDLISRWQQHALLYRSLVSMKTRFDNIPTRQPRGWKIVDPGDRKRVATWVSKRGGAVLADPGALLISAMWEVARDIRIFPAMGFSSSRGISFSTEIGGGSLEGGLAWQMVLAWGGRLQLAPCGGCGQPHAPARLQAGRKSYCTVCRGRGAPQQAADRARRERERLIREMAARGENVELIAEIVLGQASPQNVARVRRRLRAT